MEVFVGGLLPLLVHGVGGGTGEGPDGGEDDKADSETCDGVEGDLLALTRLGERPRAVGTEGDPVRYRGD